ncbi:hypothetical protein BDV41DRAFT_542902 [Aspergillus transmontanensis]|uniref:Uncharacterized protein n=1 Tax=Aspergillus transmontanensis TaxID=1034304 RepID=A0A5N6VS55_9EURO|nr:hypothetical protein BDV41DRAFT_542902 [Aspergillus transmontanensis]
MSSIERVGSKELLVISALLLLLGSMGRKSQGSAEADISSKEVSSKPRDVLVGASDDVDVTDWMLARGSSGS